MKYILAWLLCALGCVPSHALVVLDINNFKSGSGTSGVFVNSSSALFQTFQVGTTGGLASVDFFSGEMGTGNLQLEVLRGGNLTTIGTDWITSLTRPSRGVGNATTTFDLTPYNIGVTAGEFMTFRLSTLCVTPGCSATWVNWTETSTGTSDNYAGGTAFYQAAGPATAYSDLDLNFRTYVDTAAVSAAPEPSTWLSMIIGFGMVGMALRRRPGWLVHHVRP